ncbi:MAG: YeiH family protein [Pseudolabrys sp.]
MARRSPRALIAGGFGLVPGLALTAGIAAVAFGLHSVPGLSALSPMILSIFIGITFHNLVRTPAVAKAGVAFSLRRILRFAIILLGLQLTAQQVVAVGGAGLAVIVTTLLATFLFTTWVGRLLGVDAKLTQLIAAGTSICGASAVIATNTVTDGSDEDVAYAVACVTVFGSIAMFSYPLLVGLLHMDPHAYGLWAGSSIHEVAQVVAAAYQDGTQAGDFGTIAKLTRVMMLAPVVLSLGLLVRLRGGKGGKAGTKVPMPWFVIGFIALIVVNSLITIPATITAPAGIVTTFGLSMALAAMGLETDIRKLQAEGLRPLLLGLIAFFFISGFSLLLIRVFT